MSKREKGKRRNLEPLSSSELLYGSNAVREVLRYAPERIHSLFLAEGSTAAKSFADCRGKLSREFQLVQKEELDSLAGTEKHQGVVAKLYSQERKDFREVFKELRDKQDSLSLVVLDRVQDPQNLGAIIRVCEAAGVGAVLLSDRQSAPISPVVRKASMGASELIPVVRVKNIADTLSFLKENGMWVVGTALDEAALNLYEAEIPRPSVFVFGSEGKGLRPLVASKCDLLVMIPMSGRMQSLNVNQAVSITLFEARRREVARGCNA